LAQLSPEVLLGELHEILSGTLGGRAADYFVSSLAKAPGSGEKGEIESLSRDLSGQLASVFGPRVAGVLEHLLVRRLSDRVGISMSGRRENLVEYVQRAWRFVGS
jgi:hypothetical protein